MERVPYSRQLEAPPCPAAAREPAVTSDWRDGLPLLTDGCVTLREVRTTDAASLFALLTTEEVARFISPPPSTVEGFEKFIAWTHLQRAAGAYACFAVTLEGFDTAIGIFQIRGSQAGLETAEWGFAIGSAFWGTGVFLEGAELLLEFAFDTLNVRRLEARAAVQNGRGNGALKKVGAVLEAILRRSFAKNGRLFDQVLFTILRSEWRAERTAGHRHVLVH